MENKIKDIIEELKSKRRDFTTENKEGPAWAGGYNAGLDEAIDKLKELIE